MSTRGYSYKSRAFWNSNPELEQYLDLKEERMKEVEDYIEKMGEYLRAGGEDTLRLRTDSPQGGVYQQNIREAYAGASWSDYERMFGRDTTDLMEDFFITGDEMPEVLVQQLAAIAQVMGTDVGSLVAQLHQAYTQE